VAVDVFDPRQSRPKRYGTARVSSDIWILDTASGIASQFTFGPGADFDPLWSPAGSTVVFSSNRRGRARSLSEARGWIRPRRAPVRVTNREARPGVVAVRNLRSTHTQDL
jgi:hypothetical protein